MLARNFHLAGQKAKATSQYSSYIEITGRSKDVAYLHTKEHVFRLQKCYYHLSEQAEEDNRPQEAIEFYQKIIAIINPEFRDLNENEKLELISLYTDVAHGYYKVGDIKLCHIYARKNIQLYEEVYGVRSGYMFRG